MDEDANDSKSQTMRKCPKCRNHNEDNLWKGHKRYCRWKKCPCVRCRLVDHRRGITKLQVRLYREQKDTISADDELIRSPISSSIDQEPLEDGLMRSCGPVTPTVLYLTVLKACHFDLDHAASIIAEAEDEVKQQKASLLGIPPPTSSLSLMPGFGFSGMPQVRYLPSASSFSFNGVP